MHPLPRWLADAIVKSLSGIALGLFLAFAVLPFVRWLFPTFQEWSIDRGMRISEMMHPVAPVPMERSLGIRGYVFVDVDAGEAAPSQAACDSVALHHASTAKAPWECAAWRPVNRFLLAALVELLRSRGAKLIIVDVDLAAGGYPLPADESTALIGALEAAGAPALAVLPAEPLRETDRSDQLSIKVPPVPGVSPAQALVLAAPALPFPGDILRRYLACYGWQTPQGHELIPSLATRSEATLRGFSDARVLCASDGEAAQAEPSRIAFTLPEVSAEPEAMSPSGDSALWNRYHLFLDHCRALDLDSADASCSQSSLFRDKIAIIGTSSRARGDRHLTPLGEMSGSMVVLNALRSRLDARPEAENSRLGRIVHDLGVCARAACVWFVAFVLLGLITQRHLAAVTTFCLRLIVVVGALSGVLWVGVKGSFSVTGTPQNLNLMFPLLAFGLEMYTNAARHLERVIERPINRWIGRMERQE